MDPKTTTVEEWLGGAFDFLCTRKAREVITPEQAELLLHRVCSSPAMKSLIERVAIPARSRVLDRWSTSPAPLAAWLPDPARDRLSRLLGRPVHIPKALVEELVTSPKVHEEIRQMLQDALLAFVESGISAAPGGKGVRGVMGLGMRAAGAVFGGLGGDVIESRVREFADKAVGRMLKQLSSYLLSHETARGLGHWRGRSFEKLLRRTESDAVGLIKWAPLAELDEVMPELLKHNAARGELRDLLRSETAAILEDLSDQSIGELCDELGLRAEWRSAFIAQGSPLLRAYVESHSYPGAPQRV